MKRSIPAPRKTIAVLILACIAFTAFAADPPVTFTCFILSPSQQPTPNNKIFRMIRERLGVSFEFDIVAGDADQKIGVMLAAGDYPDIVSGHKRFIDGGTFIPLEDLIEKHAPRLKAHYKDAWNLMKVKDGHIYVLPNYGVFRGKYRYNESYGPAFWIQRSVLKEFGYPKPKTLDEYFDLIKRYKAKYPTIDGQPTIGFSILCEGWRDFCLRNPPQHLIGFPNDGDVVVKNGVAEIFADKDFAKRYYKKLNEMNQLGLIDKETFVLSYDQYIARLSSGRVLGVFDQRWNFQRSEQSLRAQEKIWRTFAACPVTFDKGIKDYYLDRPPVNVNNGFGISKSCRNPVRVIKMLDTLLDEEWQKLLQWGEKGVEYLVDKNGRFYRTQEMRLTQDDPAYRQANNALEFGGQLPKIEGTYSDGNATSPGMQPEEYFAGLRDPDRELLKAYGFKTMGEFFSEPPENPPHYPVWTIQLADGTPGKLANTKLVELGKKWLPRVILANPKQFDATWDKYVKEIRKINVKAYEDAINAEIRIRLANVKKK